MHSERGESSAGVEVMTGRTVSPITARLWATRQKISKLLSDDLSQCKEQSVLTPKQPKFTSVRFPFSQDPELVDQYRNPWGYVRLGRILEDLDSLAGNIAYEHCDDGDPETVPPLLVTAGVEKIALRRQLRLDQDMLLRGRVVWTGKSSLDIAVEVVDASGNDCLTAHFFFVARSSLSGGSIPVNPVEPASPAERELWEDASRRVAARKEAARRVSGEAEDGPTKEWVDAIMARSRNAMDMPTLMEPGWVWRGDTEHENLLMCQPQQRNIHGRIFGGFLMRRAFELAFTTCYAFAGSRPAFLVVDDISFRRPVDVGALLRLKSSVTHVEHKYNPGPPWLKAAASHAVVHVEVSAHVVQPEVPASQVTNTFRFRFAVDNTKRQLVTILPRTRDEAREMYLAASQHF